METPFEQLKDLYLVADWALFYGYTEISQKTVIEIVSRGGTIGRNSPLEKRLAFGGYYCSIQDSSKLDDSLKFLDELDDFFSKDCNSEQTNSFHWVKIRHSTVRQIAIHILKDYLKIENQLPQFPQDIKIPKSFPIKRFKEEIEKLFVDTKKYGSATDLGKIEDSLIKRTKIILFEPFSSSHIDKEALHYLLHLFTTNAFKSEAISFAKAVEREVLDTPGYFCPPTGLSETKNVIPIPDWKDIDRETNGPYAPITSQTEETPEDLDGNETDEQNAQSQEQDLVDNSTASVVHNLHTKRDQFVQNNMSHDPLLEATGLSDIQPIVSHAGRPHAKQSEGENPKKKQRLIDGRNSASEVVWDESEDEEVSDIRQQEASKLTIENVQKQKFQPQLSKSKGSRQSVGSPSGQSVVERDKGVRLAWTKDEEDALLAGVDIHGVGAWVQILQDPNLSYRFRGRTNVNLKDKYRNLNC